MFERLFFFTYLYKHCLLFPSMLHCVKGIYPWEAKNDAGSLLLY